MILRRLELENFKGITSLAIDFGEEVNVIYGPNEAGKSTLIEAIDRALLGDADSSKQEYRDIVPWDSRGVKAQVRLSFSEDISSLGYRIEKTFPQGGAKLMVLEEGGERLVAQGREVNRILRERIGIEEGEEELLRLLWIRQGRSIDLLSRSDGPVSATVRQRLKEVLRGSLSPEGTKRVYRRLLEERAQYRTNTGRLTSKNRSRGGRIVELQNGVENTNEEIRQLETRLSDLERASETITRINEEIEKKSREIGEADACIARLEKERARYAEIEKLRLKLEPLESARRNYRDALEGAKEAERRLPKIYPVYAELLRERLAEARETQRLCGDLQREIGEMETLAAAHRGIGAELIEEAKSLTDALWKIEYRLEQTDFSVSLLPLRELELDLGLDGELRAEELLSPDDGEKSFKVNRRFSLDYPEHFKLEVTGPISRENLEKLEAEREKNSLRLDSLLKDYGGKSVEELSALFEKERKEREQLKELTRRYANLKPEEVEKSAGEIESKLAELPAKHAAARQNDERNPAQFEANKEGLQELEERIGRLRYDAEREAERADRVLQEQGIEEIEELERRREELIERLEELIEPGTGEESTGVNGEEEPAKVKLRRTSAAEELTGLKERRAAVKAELQRNEDPQAELEETGRRRERLMRELKGEILRLRAIDTLISAMDEKRRSLEERIFLPLEQRLSEHFALLTGSRYRGIRLGEDLDNLGLQAESFDGSIFAVSTDELSYGTREQLSFLFRLVLAESLADGVRQLMILDDSFVNSDAGRFEKMLRMIKERERSLQVLIFTCREDEYLDTDVLKADGRVRLYTLEK